MTRRANGEGTIYRRSDGRWEAALYVPDAEGRRRRKRLYGRTRAEVATQLRAASARIDRGLPAVDAGTRLDVYLPMWLDQVARPTLRPKTIEGYETVIRRHLLPRIGAKTLRSLTTSDVRVLMAGMTKQGLAPRTVQYVHAVLRTALAQAVRDDLVGRNVASVVRAPRQTRREAAFLTPDEARQLIAAAKGTDLEAVVVVALTLGLRRGELLGLRWSAINLDAGQLRIVATVQRVSGELLIEEPKTRSSVRTLPVPAMTITALREHRVRQAARRLAAGPRWRDHDLVFTSGVGSPIDPRNFDREFKELLDSACVPRIRFHDLRHTFATFLLAEGTPARVVMELLGHSQIGITMNTYAHVLPALSSASVEAVATQLGVAP